MIPALTLAGAGYSTIAGTDLKIGGNPVNGFKGAFYAKDQFDISGNPTLAGQVIAGNQGDLPFPNPAGINLVELKAGGIMEISGNPTIVNSEIDAVFVLSSVGLARVSGFRSLEPLPVTSGGSFSETPDLRWKFLPFEVRLSVLKGTFLNFTWKLGDEGRF